MAEEILPETVTDGMRGALSDAEVLHKFHNSWITQDGTRVHLPTDFDLAGTAEAEADAAKVYTDQQLGSLITALQSYVDTSISSALEAGTTIPGAPSIVSITPTSGQVVVVALPSSTGGSAITGYTATATPVGGGASLTGTDDTATVTITGLTNGTAYTLTVHATNANGNSPESAQSNPFTPPAVVPDAPVITSAVAGDGQATITFSAPASNGGAPITGYTAISTPGSFTATTDTLEPLVVTGLTNGTGYTFTVHATNAVGNSSESTASSTVTPTASTSNTPTNLDVIFANERAFVCFQPPPSGTIVSYQVACIPTSGAPRPDDQLLTPVSGWNKCVFRDLVQPDFWNSLPGASYRVEVTANFSDESTSKSEFSGVVREEHDFFNTLTAAGDKIVGVDAWGVQSWTTQAGGDLLGNHTYKNVIFTSPVSFVNTGTVLDCCILRPGDVPGASVVYSCAAMLQKTNKGGTIKDCELDCASSSTPGASGIVYGINSWAGHGSATYPILIENNYIHDGHGYEGTSGYLEFKYNLTERCPSRWDRPNDHMDGIQLEQGDEQVVYCNAFSMPIVEYGSPNAAIWINAKQGGGTGCRVDFNLIQGGNTSASFSFSDSTTNGAVHAERRNVEITRNRFRRSVLGGWSGSAFGAPNPKGGLGTDCNPDPWQVGVPGPPYAAGGVCSIYNNDTVHGILIPIATLFDEAGLYIKKCFGNVWDDNDAPLTRTYPVTVANPVPDPVNGGYYTNSPTGYYSVRRGSTSVIDIGSRNYGMPV